MLPVPELRWLDRAFGNIDYLPKWEDIPAEFKVGSYRWCLFISKLFYVGIKKEEFDALVPRKGIDKTKAFSAMRCCLMSFEPKHEHKEAGCAYLMNQWFEDLKEDTIINAEEMKKVLGNMGCDITKKK